MAVDPELRRLRAKQVGMLMRAYRLAYSYKGSKRKLSQNRLLDLMGMVDKEYAEMDGHSSVARWESGATRPNERRIEVFGQALNLSPAEVSGLKALAGFEDDDASPNGSGESVGAAANVPHSTSDLPHRVPNTPRVHSFMGSVIGKLVSMLLLPGLFIAGVGYLLSMFGMNIAWILTVYVLTAIGVVAGVVFLNTKLSGGDTHLRELYFGSIFVLLSAPMLHAPLTRMDIYGFYALEGIESTLTPHLLALLVNLLLAVGAGFMFDLLFRWQYSSGFAERRAYTRAAWVALPPLAFVYVFVFMFCSTSTCMYATAVFPILAGMFTVSIVLRDNDISVSLWDRNFMLWTTAAGIIALSVLGGAATLMLYWEPIMLGIPDHNLFHSWEVDFVKLGYVPEELGDRVRLGTVWTSLFSLAFIVLVIGGNLIATIHRMGGGGSASLAAQTAPVANGSSSRNQKRSAEVSSKNVFYLPGWIRKPTPPAIA